MLATEQPLHYWETHAGSASYPLSPSKARGYDTLEERAWAWATVGAQYESRWCGDLTTQSNGRGSRAPIADDGSMIGCGILAANVLAENQASACAPRQAPRGNLREAEHNSCGREPGARLSRASRRDLLGATRGASRIRAQVSGTFLDHHRRFAGAEIIGAHVRGVSRTLAQARAVRAGLDSAA